jgi:oligopeptide/dipeptide ABC transporter ATP-binding protein
VVKSDRPILEVENLQADFPTPKGNVKAVNNVSFSIQPGEIVALVGESGSGKSVTALSIMRLNASTVRYGRQSAIRFNDKDLLKLKEREMRSIRGNHISMIFQDPMSSLNPLQRIEKQIAEPIQRHQHVGFKKAQEISLSLLVKVGIPDAEKRLRDYPHQLSGGMRQRVMIAMALACNPTLLIADEPTTALDVTIQAQILNLMKALQKQTNTAILLITHDLGVVAEMADRVMVMYCGEIVEEGDVYAIFERPLHPYTKGLMASVPKLTGRSAKRLEAIPGTVPHPLELPQGCYYSTRCAYATAECMTHKPRLVTRQDGRQVACWHPLEEESEVTKYG